MTCVQSRDDTPDVRRVSRDVERGEVSNGASPGHYVMQNIARQTNVLQTQAKQDTPYCRAKRQRKVSWEDLSEKHVTCNQVKATCGLVGCSNRSDTCLQGRAWIMTGKIAVLFTVTAVTLRHLRQKSLLTDKRVPGAIAGKSFCGRWTHPPEIAFQQLLIAAFSSFCAKLSYATGYRRKSMSSHLSADSRVLCRLSYVVA